VSGVVGERRCGRKVVPKHLYLQCAECNECAKEQSSSLRNLNVPSTTGNQARQVEDMEVVEVV
jgi:hypothetical protein